jgi:DnaK suppressor protein
VEEYNLSDQLDLQNIRRSLIRERRQLLGLLGEDEDQPIRDPEENPDATVIARDYQMLEVDSRLDQLNAQRIERINLALERIDRGEYGICQSCRQPIDPDRLRLMPDAGLCMDCQTQQDVENNQRWKD